MTFLVFCVLWSAREWDNVTDVGHAGNEEEQSLESETESAVRGRSEAACVEVPLETLAAHAGLLDACLKLL